MPITVHRAFHYKIDNSKFQTGISITLVHYNKTNEYKQITSQVMNTILQLCVKDPMPVLVVMQISKECLEQSKAKNSLILSLYN